MKADISKSLQKRKSKILENWMSNQVADESLREDLMSNDELREQSNELLEALLNNITDKNITNASDAGLEPVHEILSGISISRARQGFSPKETGLYVFSLKDALLQNVQEEYGNDAKTLIDTVLKINK